MPEELTTTSTFESAKKFYRRGCPMRIARLLAYGLSLPKNDTYQPRLPFYPDDKDDVVSPPWLYLSGPMRGYPDFNFPAFDKARDNLVQKGWGVISPADVDRANFDFIDGMSGTTMPTPSATAHVCRDFAHRDFHALYSLRAENGDAIAMLPAWELSVGAVAEFYLARWVKVKILDATTGEPLRNIDTESLVSDSIRRLVEHSK